MQGNVKSDRAFVSRRVATALLVVLSCALWAPAQDSAPAPTSKDVSAPASAQNDGLAHRPAQAPAEPPAVAPQSVALTVPRGTPLHVALDQELRVGRPGQSIQGHVVEPIYAFDKLVIPVGTKVTGQITRIKDVPAGKRTVAALDANFTPSRPVEVEFSQIALPDGKQLAVHTTVTPGSGDVVEFVSAADVRHSKGVKDAGAERTHEAKQEAKQEWNDAMKAVKQPGKAHRLERFALAELPVHPQYIDAGTTYFAELQESIEFGTETLTPEAASSLGETPPEGSVVQARLMTALSSETAHPGDRVEAIVSRPLFDGDRLIIPQGSFLEGTVIQAQPARHPGRNGQLRIVFREIHLESGVQRKVQATLAGVEAPKAQNLRLDSEGGARSTSPNGRFLTTGLEVGLAGFAFIGDSGGGDLAHSSAGGAGGYKLIGLGLGLATRSQPLGMAMGAFGATRSIYGNFIARGHDVVFPKNTAMSISVGTRPAGPANAAAPDATRMQ
ncbi:MAG TPA: hypothetical protein VMM16_00100 [Verrucomicrobiae bacterium]|nr:hypothetical protein [Verrucomicrobiae bacterium]